MTSINSPATLAFLKKGVIKKASAMMDKPYSINISHNRNMLLFWKNWPAAAMTVTMDVTTRMITKYTADQDNLKTKCQNKIHCHTPVSITRAANAQLTHSKWGKYNFYHI